MICVGMSLVWTSPVLQELKGPDSPLSRPPTLQEQEWIGSLILLGGTFGPMVTVPLTRFVGRRWVIMGMSVPMIVGWLVAGIATNVYYIYAARFLWGCTLGISSMMVPIYVGEIAEDSIRGALGSMFALNLNLGFFLSFFVGKFASYWGLTAVGGVLSVVYLGLSWNLPETPFYLIYEGRTAEASQVLQNLRDATEDQVSVEVKSLQNTIEREFLEKPRISDLWSTNGSLKALLVCAALAMTIQLCGINVILFYLEELFGKLKVKMSTADGPILIGAVQTITSGITPFIIERLGRRFLLYSTLLGMAISQAIIGLYTFLESYYKMDMSSVTFIPVLFIIVYIVLFTWGVGPIPFILVSEMFRPKIKCLASAICASSSWFSGFILTRFYSELTDAYGRYTGFWLLAVFCAGGSAVAFFLLIETKGKTFEEIQDILNNRSSEQQPEIQNVS